MAAEQPDDQQQHGNETPFPVSIVADLLSYGARMVRDLPAEAAKLPMRGIGLAFTVVERAQKGREQLRHHGEQLAGLVQALRAENEAGAERPGEPSDAWSAAAGSEAPSEKPAAPVAPSSRGADFYDDSGAIVTDLAAHAAAQSAAKVDTSGEVAQRRARTRQKPPATTRSAAAPKQPAKRAGRRPRPDAAELGAPGTAHEAALAAERAVADNVVPGEELSTAELPLPDFDHLSIGALRSRLPRLDRDQLVQLLGHERSHANRLQVVTMLENRVAKVEAGPAKKAAARAPRHTTKARPAKKAAAAGETVEAPDGGDAQKAAEEFGSNSPHP